jgi:hypothetical protein
MRYEPKFLGKVVRQVSTDKLYTVVGEGRPTNNIVEGCFAGQTSTSEVDRYLEVVPFGMDPNSKEGMERLNSISAEAFDFNFFKFEDMVDPAYAERELVVSDEAQRPGPQKSQKAKKTKKTK